MEALFPETFERDITRTISHAQHYHTVAIDEKRLNHSFFICLGEHLTIKSIRLYKTEMDAL